MTGHTRSGPADTYNYDMFAPAPYIDGGCDGPTPGTAFGDAVVWHVDGTATTLGALADGRTLVVELGSTTCPLYRGNVPRMRRVAERHPEVAWLLLYTREAHPGERRGAHASLADKCEAAAELPQEADEWRTVVVDDLDGTLHRRLGAAPNSAVVLDGQARIVAWLHDNDPRAVDVVLRDLRAGRAVSPPSPVFRPATPATTVRTLLRGGWRALADFVRAFPVLARYRLSGGPDC